MSDLIDRQAAIEALKPCAGVGNRALEKLRALPTAEPRWIPCGERFPEEEQRVLCQTVTKKGAVNIVIGYHAEGRWCCGMNSNVLAWQELPEPYKEER